MKRWHRRALGIGLGLILGWSAAGLVTDMPRGYAADTAPAVERHDPGHDHDEAHGPTAGEQLADHASLKWLPWVLGVSAALFIAAALFGPWAMRFTGSGSSPGQHDDGQDAEH